MNVEILCKNGSEMMQILGVGDPPPPFGCLSYQLSLDSSFLIVLFLEHVMSIHWVRQRGSKVQFWNSFFDFDFYWRLSLKFTWPTDCLVWLIWALHMSLTMNFHWHWPFMYDNVNSLKRIRKTFSLVFRWANVKCTAIVHIFFFLSAKNFLSFVICEKIVKRGFHLSVPLPF